MLEHVCSNIVLEQVAHILLGIESNAKVSAKMVSCKVF